METWKEIAFNPNYSVSDYGRVRNNKTGRILSTRPDKKGYARASLQGKDYKVHRLVAMAFLDNPNNYDQVNHKDGNKLNNRVDNLEWCNNSQNLKHAYSLNLKVQRGEKNGNAKLTDEQVIKIWETKITAREVVNKYGLSYEYARLLVNKKKRTYLLSQTSEGSTTIETTSNDGR